MRICGIYRIINKKNGKFYIGSSEDIKKRWKRHKYDLTNNRHHNIHLQRAWNKYGGDAFTCKISIGCTQDELFMIEQAQIDGYFATKLCYNMSPCASGGDIISNHPEYEKIVSKISKSVRKNISNMTIKERKEKWGRPGKLNPNHGNKWTDEKRKKAAERMKKRFRSPEERKKISKARKKYFENQENRYKQSIAKKKYFENQENRYKQSIAKKKYFENQENRYKQSIAKKKYFVENPNAREKLSELARERTGHKNPFYGKKHAEETKEKIRKKNLGKYRGNQEKPVEIDGITYRSVSEAARQLGICPASVIFRIKSKNIKFIGYKY